jgi:hypothetical protein
LRRERAQALKRHARAVDAVFTSQDEGGRPTPEQYGELKDARKHFDALRPHGARDAEAAYAGNPDLAREAAGGSINRTIRALQLETELRSNPELRADRFVSRWKALGAESDKQYVAGDMDGMRATRAAMSSAPR